MLHLQQGALFFSESKCVLDIPFGIINTLILPGSRTSCSSQSTTYNQEALAP
jgi:hypothetical protein